MRSETDEARTRSGAELAFNVMRALATARLLWGCDAALPLGDLSGLVQAPAEAVAAAVDRLCDEGIIEVSRVDATIRFTDAAVRDMCANRSGDAAALRRVAARSV
jgi:hypothetical protein